MSRSITISSQGKILETDLAEEVVREMAKQKLRFDLTFDRDKLKFVSQQYDDSNDTSILIKAEESYHRKLQKKREHQIEERLKKEGYEVEKIKKDGKIKIIAKQRVYA